MNEPNITPFPGLEMITTEESYLEFFLKAKELQDVLNKSLIDLCKEQQRAFDFEVTALNNQVSYLTRRVAKLEKQAQGPILRKARETKSNLSGGRTVPV